MTRNEMIKAMAREMCQSGGFDPDERMPNDGPRWPYYVPMATAAFDRIARALIEQGRRAGHQQATDDVVASLRESAAWHNKADDGLSGYAAISNALTEHANAIQRGEHAGDRP